MVRIITQILVGLMLFFGVLTLGERVVFYIRTKNIRRALYFLVLWSLALLFCLMAFYFAYAELKGLDGMRQSL